MTLQLFSTYRQGENRVTSTFLAVLQRLSLPRIDRILRALLEEDSFSLVSFRNQPLGENQSSGKKATPDARIGRGDTVWIETKTSPGAVDYDQLLRHLEGLSDGERLLFLTPHNEEPKDLPDGVVWSNFGTLVDAVTLIFDDEDDPPSEMEALLLREFVWMLRADGLLASGKPTAVVVAASSAWPMYETLPAYRSALSLPFRSPGQFDHMAFYVKGEIKPVVPKVKSIIDSIDLTREGGVASLPSPQKEHAKELLTKMDSAQRQWFNGNFKVMFLSEPDDAETERLGASIVNDKTGQNGKPVPFTYGRPRYVTMESLKKAHTTTELEALNR